MANVMEVYHLATDSGGWDEDGIPFEDHIYKVRFSSPDYLPLSAVGASAGGVTVPSWHSVRAGSYLVATTIDISKISDKPNWCEVKVHYEPPKLNDADAGGGGATDLWNKTVTVQTQESTETINCTVSGKAMKNSYGDIYDASVSETFYDEIITLAFKAKASSFDPDQLSKYRGYINNAQTVITIGHWQKTFLPYCMKLQKVDYSTTTTAYGEPSFDIQIELGYRRNQRLFDDIIDPPSVAGGWPAAVVDSCYGWIKIIQDRGFRYYDDNDKAVPFMDDDNITPSSVPGYLDGEGGKYDIAIHDNKPRLWAYLTCKTVDFNNTELGKL